VLYDNRPRVHRSARRMTPFPSAPSSDASGAPSMSPHSCSCAGGIHSPLRAGVGFRRPGFPGRPALETLVAERPGPRDRTVIRLPRHLRSEGR